MDILKHLTTLSHLFLGILKLVILPIRKPLHTIAFVCLFVGGMWAGADIHPKELPAWLEEHVLTRASEFSTVLSKHALKPIKETYNGAVAMVTGKKIEGHQSSVVAQFIQQKQEQEDIMQSSMKDMGYEVPQKPQTQQNSSNVFEKTPKIVEKKKIKKEWGGRKPVAYSLEEFSHFDETSEAQQIVAQKVEIQQQPDQSVPKTPLKLIETIKGYPRVIFGDKLLVNTTFVKLHGIKILNESSQEQAKDLMNDMINSIEKEENRIITCGIFDYTLNKIPLAVCSINDIEINRALVEASLAYYVD